MDLRTLGKLQIIVGLILLFLVIFSSLGIQWYMDRVVLKDMARTHEQAQASNEPTTCVSAITKYLVPIEFLFLGQSLIGLIASILFIFMGWANLNSGNSHKEFNKKISRLYKMIKKEIEKED